MSKAISHCGELSWYDFKKGKQKAKPEMFGDIILARKDIPTSYNLSVVVDDYKQGISRVTRGLDLFPSTHIHRILQSLLGYPAPEYCHHRLITDDKGIRLSKRNNSATLKSLREAGKTPNQVLNLLSHLNEL